SRLFIATCVEPGTSGLSHHLPLAGAIPGEEEKAMPLTRDEDIFDLLAGTRTIAMIGASDRPDRPSYGVMAFLQSRGYRVLPVNPQITGEHVHGEYVWRALAPSRGADRVRLKRKTPALQ